MTRQRKLAEEEALIEWHLKKIVVPLGYAAIRPLPYEVRASRVWWFARSGSDFTIEMICCPFQRKPCYALTVEYFASPFSEEVLRGRGLNGQTAIGTSLYAFEAYTLNRSDHELVGEIVTLPKGRDWSEVFNCLGSEIAAVDGVIWQDLWAAWQKRHPSATSKV